MITLSRYITLLFDYFVFYERVYRTFFTPETVRAIAPRELRLVNTRLLKLGVWSKGLRGLGKGLSSKPSHSATNDDCKWFTQQAQILSNQVVSFPQAML